MTGLRRFQANPGEMEEAVARAQELGLMRLIDLRDGRGERPLSVILAEADEEIAASERIMARVLAEFEGTEQ